MSGMEDKIRKLMRLADHPGTGAEEAASAAAMAAELGLKYNIELDGLNKEAHTKKAFVKGDKDFAVTLSDTRDRPALSSMGKAVGELYGCDILIKRLGGLRSAVFFIGQQHNIDLANSWLRYLWTACTNSNKEYARTRYIANAKERYRVDSSFRAHFCHEVALRLREKLAAMRTQGTSESTALVVVNWFETEKREVQLWMAENLNLGKPVGGRAHVGDSQAAKAGYQAGNRVGLDDQIGQRNATRRLN